MALPDKLTARLDVPAVETDVPSRTKAPAWPTPPEPAIVTAPEKAMFVGRMIVPPLKTLLLEDVNEARLATRREPPVMERPPLVFVPEMTLLPLALMSIPVPVMTPDKVMTELVEPVSVRLVPEMVTALDPEILPPLAFKVPV